MALPRNSSTRAHLKLLGNAVVLVPVSMFRSKGNPRCPRWPRKARLGRVHVWRRRQKYSRSVGRVGHFTAASDPHLVSFFRILGSFIPALTLCKMGKFVDLRASFTVRCNVLLTEGRLGCSARSRLLYLYIADVGLTVFFILFHVENIRWLGSFRGTLSE